MPAVNAQATIRVITPTIGPDRMVSRVEGGWVCRGCARVHPYRLDLFANYGDPPAESQIFNNWEDAAHQVRAWLPDAACFLGHRELADPAAEVIDEQEFNGREQALAWLLRSGK